MLKPTALPQAADTKGTQNITGFFTSAWGNHIINFFFTFLDKVLIKEIAITATSQVFKKCLSQKDLINNSVYQDGANACQCIMYYANVPSAFYQYVSFSVQCIQPPTQMTNIRLQHIIDLQQPLSTW